MYGVENDFVYVYEQTNIDETFCNLKMERKCLVPTKYHNGGNETKTLNKMRKTRVEYSKQVFEKVPPLKPTHHVSVDIDVPGDIEQELRETYLVKRVKLHPTIPHNVSGVEGGVCFCTIGLENQLGLLEELKKSGIPDSWMSVWEDTGQ